jgi:hypothetical protein
VSEVDAKVTLTEGVLRFVGLAAKARHPTVDVEMEMFVGFRRALSE